jgi:hypothetical protein
MRQKQTQTNQKNDAYWRQTEMLESVSLKNVPMDERRKEAKKPLFLTRYE